MAVQQYNPRQQPSRVRDLWRDRRNPLQWYSTRFGLCCGWVNYDCFECFQGDCVNTTVFEDGRQALWVDDQSGIKFSERDHVAIA